MVPPSSLASYRDFLLFDGRPCAGAARRESGGRLDPLANATGRRKQRKYASNNISADTAARGAAAA